MTIPDPCIAPSDPTLAALYPLFLAALLAGDRRRCEALTEQAVVAGVSILVLYQQLFQRALYQVGEEWAQNRISVGIEHLATAIVEGLLNRFYPAIAATRHTGRRILISSVEGELHQVGAKMACDAFEMSGWDALYLGADTPTRELLRTIDALHPDAVGLSLSVSAHLPRLLDAIRRIRADFPDLPVLVGGQGLRQVAPALFATLIQDPGVQYLADIKDLECVGAGLGRPSATCPDRHPGSPHDP